MDFDSTERRVDHPQIAPLSGFSFGSFSVDDITVTERPFKSLP
jgi:hypothetical protein